MIQRLWAWLTGYLVLKFKGPGVEILFNRILDADWDLWDIERLSVDTLIAKISIKGFRKIRPLVRDLPVRINIVGKYGFPFYLNKAQTRYFLFIGFIVFAILLYYLSGFIWFVQITGLEQVSKEEVIEILIDQGVQVGTRKTDLSPRSIENQIMSEISEIAWVGISVRGVLAKIQIVEKSMPDPSTQLVGDVIAARDGIITQVMTFRGIPQVRVGDTVRKGDVLISGEYYDQYGRKQHGRAEGLVRARVWYEAIGEAAFYRIIQQRTGNSHTGYVLKIGGKELGFRKKPPFENYVVEKSDWKLDIVNGFQLLQTTKLVYYEVVYETVVIPEEEARALALMRAWEMLEAEGIEKHKITETQIREYTIVDDYGVRIGLLVELEDDIGAFASAKQE